MGGSFASQVKKANLNSAQSKNVSACFMNHALHRNRWYKGKSATGAEGAAVTSYKFENMFSDITHGTNDHQRVGDEFYLEKLSLRLFMSSPAAVGSCIKNIDPKQLPRIQAKLNVITSPIAQETRRSYTAGECSAEQAMVQMIAVRVTTVRKLMHEKPEGRSNLRNEAPTEAENKSGY